MKLYVQATEGETWSFVVSITFGQFSPTWEVHSKLIPASKKTWSKFCWCIFIIYHIHYTTMESQLSIEQIKAIFLREGVFIEHFNIQKSQPELYTSVLILLLNQGVEFSVGNPIKFFFRLRNRNQISYFGCSLGSSRY